MRRGEAWPESPAGGNARGPNLDAGCTVRFQPGSTDPDGVSSPECRRQAPPAHSRGFTLAPLAVAAWLGLRRGNARQSRWIQAKSCLDVIDVQRDGNLVRLERDAEPLGGDQGDGDGAGLEFGADGLLSGTLPD